MDEQDKPALTAIHAFFAATNLFDVPAALAVFTNDAVIDDPSTGHIFTGLLGVQDYLERYFVAYQTVTRMLECELFKAGRAHIKVDFTGDFGHEIGVMDISLNAEGLITHIHAYLE